MNIYYITMLIEIRETCMKLRSYIWDDVWIFVWIFD